jgi:transposase
MTEKLNLGGLPATRNKYTPAFNAECVRQVAAGAWQTDVARAQGLEAAVPSSAERDEIKRLRAELKRVERERDMLKSRDQLPAVGAGSLSPFPHEPLPVHPGRHGTVARAGALPLVGRAYGRLVSVAIAARCGSGTLVRGGPAGVYALCRPLRHPPPAGRMAGRGPRRGPLRPALVVASTGLACPEHPAAAPAPDDGRPGGRGGRKPAAGPAGPHRPEPGQGWGQHVLAAAGRALGLAGHLARCVFAPGRGRWCRPGGT